MGRRRNNWNRMHMDGGDRPHPIEGRPARRYSLCGEHLYEHDRRTSSEAAVTCTACQQKLDARAIKARTDIAFGEAIKDKAVLGYSYRSIWPLKHNGKVVGFATLQNGWGKSWVLREISETGAIGDEVGGRYDSVGRADTKEKALLKVPDLVEKGLLGPIDDAEGKMAKARAEAARQKIELEARQRTERYEREQKRREFLSIALLGLNHQQMQALASAYRATYYGSMPGPSEIRELLESEVAL